MTRDGIPEVLLDSVEPDDVKKKAVSWEELVPAVRSQLKAKQSWITEADIAGTLGYPVVRYPKAVGEALRYLLAVGLASNKGEKWASTEVRIVGDWKLGQPVPQGILR